MALNPATIDLLIVTTFKGLELLGKMAKGEEIQEKDLQLEPWETTATRIRVELEQGGAK